MEKYETPDGRIQLYHGDCLEIMPTLPEKSVDMVLCDPPYGTTACKWDSVIPFEPMWANYKRLSGGAVVLFGSQPFTSFLVTSNPSYFKYSWVWEKSVATGHLNAKKRPMKNTEDIVVFYGGQCLYNPQGVEPCCLEMMNSRSHSLRSKDNPTSTVSGGIRLEPYKQTQTNYPRQLLKFGSAGSPKHPTQKPVALCEYLIKTYTHEDFTVLDNCMGSGTTGVACVNTGRKFIGIEKEEKHFEIAKKRIQDAWDKKYCN